MLLSRLLAAPLIGVLDIEEDTDLRYECAWLVLSLCLRVVTLFGVIAVVPYNVRKFYIYASRRALRLTGSV